MNDDELIKQIAKAATRDTDGGRLEGWERVARGLASAEECARLGSLAAAEGDEDALRAMAPLDVTSAVMARLDAAKRQRARRPWAPVFAIGGAVALAASVALVVGRGGPAAPPLPAYTMTATGGEMALRGAPPATEATDAPLLLGKRAQLSITLRPSEDVSKRPIVRTALVREGHAEPWSPPVSISSAGVVTIEGDAEELVPGPNGPCSLVVVIGASRVAESASEIAATAPDASHVVRRIEVILKGR